jgi:hypothetical protein
MRVFKRPRSPFYYFDFDLGGQTHVKSTRLKNEPRLSITRPPTGLS